MEIFKDVDSFKRKYLYKLEDAGIFKQIRVKLDKTLYSYDWILTEKGEKLIKNNFFLKKLLDNKDFKQLYIEITNENAC